MKGREGAVVLAAVAILALGLPVSGLGLATTTTAGSSATGSSSYAKVTITIYPDGSIGLSATGNETATATPGTEPNLTLSARVSTSQGQSTLDLNGTLLVPQSELTQAPFNYSGSVSASGSYSDGVSKGQIITQALPGLASQLGSVSFSYNGNATSLTSSGTATVEYGTYETSTGPLVLNASTIAQYISAMEANGLNTSALNNELATLPFESDVNLHVSEFTITPSYGSSSATIQESFVMTGNMAALPAAYTSYYLCQESQYASSVCPSSSKLSSALFDSINSWSYTFTYSGGTMSFSASIVGTQNFNLNELLQIEGSSSSGASKNQAAFYNSTTIDISGSSMTLAESQSPNGRYVTQFTESGVTLYPEVSPVNGELNESGFFNLLGSSGPGNYTIVGGSNQAGSVTFVVPPTVPGPEQKTANSASWTDVNGSALADLQFSTVPTTATSSASTTSASPSTAETTTTSSGSSVPEFPFGSLAAVVVTLAVVIGYTSIRRKSNR